MSKHNKDVLVSEFSSVFLAIPFSSNKFWSRKQLNTQYRIANRRLASVANSFTGDNGDIRQREVSDYDKKMLRLNDNETAIIASSGNSNYGTLIILTEVDHVTQGHPNYFKA